ncbi:hypothetical protein DRQ07_02430, partial [candidate division KSB1 bacterium]
MFILIKKFKILTLLSVILSLLSIPQNICAQKISGKLYENHTNRPVSKAIIMILNTRNRIYDVTMSDSLGQFSFDKLKLRSFIIKTYRYGFKNIVTDIYKIKKSDTLFFQIGLDPEPILLDSVYISSDRIMAYLLSTGFYKRMKSKTGYFFTQQDIEDKAPYNLGQLFDDIPGMIYQSSQTSANGFKEPGVYSLRHLHNNIPANIYVDGKHVDSGFIDLIPPDQVMAVEV